MIRRPPRSPLFPYPPLSRSGLVDRVVGIGPAEEPFAAPWGQAVAEEEAHVGRRGEERDRRVEVGDGLAPRRGEGDRKSTRLNSSHLVISYAVFCLKKKNIIYTNTLTTSQIWTFVLKVYELETGTTQYKPSCSYYPSRLSDSP